MNILILQKFGADLLRLYNATRRGNTMSRATPKNHKSPPNRFLYQKQSGRLNNVNEFSGPINRECRCYTGSSRPEEAERYAASSISTPRMAVSPGVQLTSVLPKIKSAKLLGGPSHS